MEQVTGPVEEQTNKIIGNSSADNLRNASVAETNKIENIKQKAIDDTTKKKIPAKDTNVDLAKLNDPEGLLAKYKVSAREGVIPVKEKKYTPSDYFKTEMMGQWLYAEGEGDKDGQKTNQAFKGIHIDSYPEFAEEIRQGKLTDEKVAEIMYRQYTGQNVAEGEPSEFRDLSNLEDVSPEAAKLLFMDAGYTGQNAEAIRDLQRYLGVKDDGLLGEDTLGAMQGFNAEAYRDHLGTLDRYKDSPVYNRFFTEEERIERGLYNRNTTKTTEEKVSDLDEEMSRRLATDDPFTDMSGTPSGYGLNYAEGGLTENNDDTLGATGEEVADDIPAQISEGELVVPANVVRYHGLSTYESLRQSALLGLEGLEDEGQLKKVDENGIPVEEDKEENDVKVQTVKMLATKKGGAPARYEEGGSPNVVVGGGRLDTEQITEGDYRLGWEKEKPRVTEKSPPPYGTTRNPRGETTVKYDPPTGTGKYNYTSEGIEKFMNENPVMNNMRIGGRKSFRYYDKETNEIIVGSHDTGTGMESFDKKETRYSPEDYFSQDQFTNSEYFNPADYFSQDLQGATKGTLTTPEGKDYRVTNPNLKITAGGPRTENVIGMGSGEGLDLSNVKFGKTKTTPSAPKEPGTVEKILSGVTTIAALDTLFNGGKITAAVYGWAKTNMFDPLGKFLGFNKAKAGASLALGNTTIPAGNPVTFINGKYYTTPPGAGAAVEITAEQANKLTYGTQGAVSGIVKSVGSVIPSGTPVIGQGGKFFVSGGLGNPGIEVSAELVDMNTMTLKGDFNVGGSSTTSPSTQSTTGVTTGQTGVWNWKTGLAAVGAALSLYDIIENGPSVANVAGLGASVGTMAAGGVFGTAATTSWIASSAVVTPLMWIAIAAGLVEAFSGPPSNKVGEAAYNFDNPEYNADDILSGGFWTRKRSDENIDGAKGLVASIGSYVAALEESLEIDIGGELFIDVGNREGLRYGYVDGYDELGMYKYHKKDLDYELLSGPGQVGKGFRGEDAVQQLMNKVNDDVNVLTMFALADKAAGGKGYATFDKIGEYRNKLNVLSSYKPAMAGSNTKAVLTEQERNILQGFQQKEFAEVTGEELAQVLTLYDKVAPVHTQNQYQNFRYSI